MSDSVPPVAPAALAPGQPAGPEDFILARRHRLLTGLAPVNPARDRVLLDFGCGNGAQTLWFAPHFRQTVAVDIDSGYLATLRGTLREHDAAPAIQPVRYDGRTLPLADRSVDYAISFEVLEHVEDERQALSELARVLRPGARLVMSVPNRWWIFETHGADLPLLPWNRVPFFSWLPKSVHDRWARARIYRRREITRKLHDNGFSVESSGYITAPMDVVPWERLQDLLRRTLFRPDSTPWPVLATAVYVVASRDAD